jgi:hypothetical protein
LTMWSLDLRLVGLLSNVMYSPADTECRKGRGKRRQKTGRGASDRMGPHVYCMLFTTAF